MSHRLSNEGKVPSLISWAKFVFRGGCRFGVVGCSSSFCLLLQPVEQGGQGNL